jgi:hypothetical protein
MKKIILSLIKISLIIPFFTFSSFAQEVEFTPANFSDDSDSLQNLIQFPNFNENIDVLVRCSSELSRFGGFQTLVCLPVQYPELLQAIADVIFDAKMTPARREGSRVGVKVTFSVRFVKVGSSEDIFVYPNFGLDTERLGLNFTAPQRVMRDLRPGGDECLFQDFGDYWAGVLVSQEGSALDVSISQPHNLTDRCVVEHSRLIRTFLFIPAVVDGVAAQATYYEQSPLAGTRRDSMRILNGADDALSR